MQKWTSNGSTLCVRAEPKTLACTWSGTSAAGTVVALRLKCERKSVPPKDQPACKSNATR